MSLRGCARLGVGAALVAALLLAACSGDDSSADPGSKDTATSSTSTTAALVIPTSPVTVGEVATPWSRDEAVQHYRDVVGPVSQQLGALSGMAPDTPTAQAQAALGAYADASKTAADALSAGSWGSDVSQQVDGLIASLLAQSDQFHHLAGLSDVAAVQAESDATAHAIAVSRAAAAALEQALGIDDGLLGPAVTSSPSTTPAGT